jgi:tripartite-type tricarboxylate transporter receptor subunit TctC
MDGSRRRLVASALALCSGAAFAFDDNKPLTLVVGYQAGGGTDVLARIVAEKLQKKLGKPVLVVNKPGATGAISATYVSNALPDGNTLLLTPGSFSYAQFVLGAGSNKLAYDPVNDFIPVAHLADTPMFWVTNRSSKIDDLNGVVERLKKDSLSYGSTGAGSIANIIGERFNQLLPGRKIVHVPYKGVAPAVSDLVAGHIPLVCTSLDAVFPYLKDGSLKLLATASGKRSKFAPDVPTFKELGFDMDLSTWYAVFAPKKTPPEIVGKINAALNDVMKDPDVIKKAESILGSETLTSTPDDLGRLNRRDRDAYQEIIKTIQFN